MHDLPAHSCWVYMKHLGAAQVGHTVVTLQKATACAAAWDFCSSAVLEAPPQQLLAEGRLRRGGSAVTQVAAQSAVLRASDVGTEGGEDLAAAPASLQSHTEQLGWKGGPKSSQMGLCLCWLQLGKG